MSGYRDPTPSKRDNGRIARGLKRSWWSIPLVWLLCTTGEAQQSSPTAPPPESVVAEARELVSAMQKSERGPYSAIRWFCEDGKVLPVQPQACRDHGGGRQHAEYSPQRARLAELGWRVGTVFAALSWEELWSGDPRQQRLRELPLERFLVDMDDGWILKRAQHYRGRVQIEDEEATGRELLLKLLSQRSWVDRNHLLARELVRTIPHGRGDNRTREIRSLAQQIADHDPGFQNFRLEVHSRPTQYTADRIRAWADGRSNLDSKLAGEIDRLVNGLNELYGDGARIMRLLNAESSLAQTVPEVANFIRRARKADGIPRVNALSEAMYHLRQNLPTDDPKLNLYRLNVMNALETELRAAAMVYLADARPQRRDLLLLTTDLLRAALAAGLLSVGEHDALVQPLKGLLQESTASIENYDFAVRRLSLVAAWAGMSVRYAFGEMLVRYQALDPLAGRFVDELLRASVLLPLGEIAERLGTDNAAASGQVHHLFAPVASGVLGLNPGVSRGTLRVFETAELAAGKQPGADEIAVLAGAVAELLPAAGIVTLGEGNPLSHIQMLARNLAIPNVSVSEALFGRLREADGKVVVLVVSSRGQVYLEYEDEAPQFITAPAPGTQPRSEVTVAAPQPDLSVTRPLPLSELHSGLSGRVVGPKAANIGELARLFPGRVARAVAVPFGVFAQYTGDQRQRLQEAYRIFREGHMSQEALDAVLDTMRREIGVLKLEENFRADLMKTMTSEFGDESDVGLFVRSDTNVEDLPEFTGAGLNKTLPNVVGREAQLAGIPVVWGSVYSPRSMRWRARVLEDPHQVFASVLLMKSIPAEKSGVLVTADLAMGGEGLTVSAAWGVGGAVDNESAASLVLRPDGTRLLLAEAKAPYHRVLNPEGGLRWIPAPSGPVLTSSDKQALRELAEEVAARYPVHTDSEGRTLPWDIEFAFTGEKLWLLQIRPLIQRGQAAAELAIAKLLPVSGPQGRVDLTEPVPPNIVWGRP